MTRFSEFPQAQLLHRLFECRSRLLSGELARTAQRRLLSGLLIASDVAGACRLSGGFTGKSSVRLIGDAAVDAALRDRARCKACDAAHGWRRRLARRDWPECTNTSHPGGNACRLSRSAADMRWLRFCAAWYPERVIEMAKVLYAAGIRIIEVPLNSPSPLPALRAGRRPPSDCLVGAGTVLNGDDVRRTHEAGGAAGRRAELRRRGDRRGAQLGMQVMPGIATATEAFSAIASRRTQLKLFPACSYGPRHLQALRAVLPARNQNVSGRRCDRGTIPGWLAAGAAGFGFGSELFRPDYSLADIERRARAAGARISCKLDNSKSNVPRRKHLKLSAYRHCRSSASMPSRSSSWHSGCRGKRVRIRRMLRTISSPAVRCLGGPSAPR